MLLTEDRSVTGLGRDPKKGLVTGPDQWWDNMMARNPKIAKFRHEALEHEDLMERVYREVTASGNEAYTAGDSDSDYGSAESFGESVGMNSDGTGLVLLSENTYVTYASKGKAQSNPNPLMQGGLSGRKRKTPETSESSDALSSSIAQPADITKKKVSILQVCSRTWGLNDALLKLKSLPIFSNPDENLDFLFWAIDLLKTSEKHVDIFCSLDTTKQMMGWLEHEKDCEAQLNAAGPTRGRPPPLFPAGRYE